MGSPEVEVLLLEGFLENTLLPHHKRCGTLLADLKAKFSIPVNVEPLRAIMQCFNSSMYAYESLRLLNDHWRQSVNPMDLLVPGKAEFHAQYADRVLTQTRMHYVFSISTMEHSGRVITDKHPDIVPLSKKHRWKYLSTIIDKSHHLGMINADDKRLWDAVITYRQVMVHNGGYASEDLEETFPDGTVLTLRKGEMTRHNLHVLVKVMDWAIPKYAEWCDAFLTRAGYPIGAKA